MLLQLRDHGTVVRGFLGVAVRPVTPEIADSSGLKEPKGVVIESVVEGSPAEKAGIQKGDVIVAVNDQPVAAPQELTRRIVGTAPGTRVDISIVRKGKSLHLPVELGRLPERR